MSETKTVILIGGTSYVASSLIRALSGGGYRQLVVTRRPRIAQMLLGDLLDQIEVVSADEAIERAAGTRPTTVNFAYVKNAAKHKVYPATRALIESIDRVATATFADRIIHMSTVAVFGYRFAQRPQPVPVRWQPGDGHTDLKIFAEHALARAASHAGYRLAIVRLGNVIGPGANPWTAGIAFSMLENKPLGQAGHLGYSNATYVKNIASYTQHLDAPVPALETFGTYHHLAEFSAHSWKEICDRMAQVIGASDLIEAPEGSAAGTYWLARPREMVAGVYRGPVGNRIRAAMASRGDLPWLDSLVGRMKEPVQLESPPVAEYEQAQFRCDRKPD
jgi:nucleoside-diphosphate-sugar epimerase